MAVDKAIEDRIRNANANVELILRYAEPGVEDAAVKVVNCVFELLEELVEASPQAGLICQQYLQTRLAMKNLNDLDRYLEAVETIRRLRGGN